MYIGEIWWMLWWCEFVDLYMLIDILWRWCDSIYVELYSRNVEYVHVFIWNHRMLLSDYAYYVEHYLTPSGCLVDRLPICMNG